MSSQGTLMLSAFWIGQQKSFIFNRGLCLGDVTDSNHWRRIVKQQWTILMHSNKTVTTNGKAAHDGPPEVGMLTKSQNTIYIVLQGNILESFGIFFFYICFLFIWFHSVYWFSVLYTYLNLVQVICYFILGI